MDDNSRDQQSHDIMKLRVMVSRLHGLAITNLKIVMNLSSALLKVPGLPDEAESEARDALSSIQQQIDVLTELAEIAETNDGR